MKVVCLEEYKKQKRDNIFAKAEKDLEEGREPFDINAELDKIRAKYENTEKP